MRHHSKQIVTEPTSEPIDLISVKDWLRITHNDQNALLNSLIKVARVYYEEVLDRAMITQTWKAHFTGWPDDYFELPMSPVASVTHIKYKNTGGTQSTLASSIYITDLVKSPARISLGYNQTWPTTELYPVAPIEIQYVAGAETIPEDMKIMLYIAIERMLDRPHISYDATLKNIMSDFAMNNRNHRF